MPSSSSSTHLRTLASGPSAGRMSISTKRRLYTVCSLTLRKLVPADWVSRMTSSTSLCWTEAGPLVTVTLVVSSRVTLGV